jgi:hypothetical protein
MSSGFSTKVYDGLPKRAKVEYDVNLFPAGFQL